jgi:hypothetical protein
VQQGQGDGPADCAEGGGHAAEHHHGDQFDRNRQIEGIWADKGLLMGEQTTGEGGEQGGDDEHLSFGAAGIERPSFARRIRNRARRARARPTPRVDEIERQPNRQQHGGGMTTPYQRSSPSTRQPKQIQRRDAGHRPSGPPVQWVACTMMT